MLYDFIGTISKTISTSPGVPQDRVDFLRKTLKKICEDKTSQQAIVQKAGMAKWYGFTTGEELQKSMVQPALAPEIKKIYEGAMAKYLVQ